MKCKHEAWEELPGGRKCTDCKEWLPPFPNVTAADLRRMLPRIVCDVETRNQMFKLFWLPQLPDDDIKREMLFVDSKDKFVHVYFLSKTFEPWPISDEQALEWVARGGKTPVGWPYHKDGEH